MSEPATTPSGNLLTDFLQRNYPDGNYTTPCNSADQNQFKCATVALATESANGLVDLSKITADVSPSKAIFPVAI